jgi:hypothetical protein
LAGAPYTAAMEKPDHPRLLVGPACLMFFADETGHETFADDRYPVFGIGGCAVISSAADTEINTPWREMKAKHFGGPDVPLHAADLRAPTEAQLSALAAFFNDRKFARFAVTMSRSTKIPDGSTPYDIAAGLLRNRFQDLLSRLSPEPQEVAFLHESSARCDQLVERHFGSNVVQVNGRVVPVHKGLVRKSAGLPALEVADFIMQASGRRALHLHRDPRAAVQKDFAAVFHSSPTWTSYMHATDVGGQEAAA